MWGGARDFPVAAGVAAAGFPCAATAAGEDALNSSMSSSDTAAQYAAAAASTVPPAGTAINSFFSLPLHYACVSRGSYVQAEFTAVNEGDEDVLSAVSRKALLRLPRTPGRKSYVFDARLFSFFVGEEGETFLCVTSEHVPADLPWNFLFDLRKEYQRQMEIALPGTGPRNFQGEMLRGLVRLVDAYNRGKGGGMQQVARVEKELEAVTEIVKENIDKVLERGEQIESLVGKTSTLADSAFDFRKEARSLRRGMWWSSAKRYIIVGAMLVVLLFLIASVACGGVTFQACFAPSSQ